MKNVALVCLSLAEAFADDPFYRSLSVDVAEDEGARKELLSHYFQTAIAEATEIGEVQYAGTDGAALWLTDEYDLDKIEAAKQARKRAIEGLLGGRGLSNYLRICSSMAERVSSELETAWYLSILGVRAEARGKKLAQALLEPTLRRADRVGAVCYLETFNPLSRFFYRRLGFTQETEHWEPITSRAYWVMVR